MPLNYEYEKKLRVGLIGAGDHAYRNILPCLQYAPIELVALAENQPERGLAVARQFGAKHFYPNHKAMLARETMDAVLIVMGPDGEGRSRYPELGVEVLRAGFHAWLDKSPCDSAKQVNTLMEACVARGKFVMTGFKKMFTPAYLKVAEIIEDPNFGEASSFALRYPLALPPVEERGDPKTMASFADWVHPFSLLARLFGECQGFTYLRNATTGGVVMNLRYRKGVIGTLHLTGGQAATSPLERLEVVGRGANVVVENGIRLVYYRPGGMRGEGVYGRSESFIGRDESAPIFWEPEFSLGQLYNKQLFLEGYVGCLRHFSERLLADQPPIHGNLVDMLHLMTMYDRICAAKENEWTTAY
jgi:predicted dehydrogenase